jgi:protein-tyrosine-phosphatase
MLSRRELVERVESRLRSRSGDDGIEASMCFLRAMLMGIEDEGSVPDSLLARVGEFLKIDPTELTLDPLTRRPSTRPPSVWPAPPPSSRAAARKVLFLARSDGARLPMLEAVGRTMLEGIADVRSAGIAPVVFDSRATKALRQAGYPTETLSPRPVSVDDLSWADVVVTCGGEREDWERFIPRSIAHEHHLIDDPIPLAKDLGPDDDELDVFRNAVRAIERVIGPMRPVRPSRIPQSGSAAPNPALKRTPTSG